MLAQPPTGAIPIAVVVDDCNGTSSGITYVDGCQSYPTDLYETWDAEVNGAGDADIDVFSYGRDSTWL